MKTIQSTTLFIGLTREVAFAGLPIMYLVVLICTVMLGFIATGSFIYFVVMSGAGYTALRGLAAYDPKIIDVFIATVKNTRISPALLKGEGVVYRA
ncbi:VirB3 family type IV secretion system protein [Ensifer sp. YR511]|uniref:VirB3 family type IV secretion system protein n=1 Tax=Ensifer sp. YR511 TaxID=1855294 RepID=UPI00088DD157|nr:VirB3 family type IV secretion system protein [Ensifer sp. YR511]SDO11344.1 type IV secretion system protein VirB3 [Ensifer sp. YR511]